jgi:hypothetical protein
MRIGARVGAGVRPTPGRDLAVFLLLLLGIDVSGLLHVYSLSAIYTDALFYGLGLLFVALAIWLLAGPSGGAGPRRLGRATVGGWAVVAGAGLVLAGLGVQQLIAALPFARAQPGDPPLLMPSRDEKTLLALVLIGLPALALALAYSRAESWRRRGLLLVAAGWFGYAVGNLLFHLTGGPNGPAWAERLSGSWPWVLGALGGVALVGLIRPFPPAVFLGLSLLVGGGLRLLAMSQIPVSMNLGDMLPLINLSTERLLGGASPYHLYHVPYDLALTYWPLNVLPFVPFRALGLDLRVANLLLGWTVGAALLLLRRGRPDPGWACTAFAVLYLTPTMFQWDLVTAAPPFWLWLSVLFAVIAGEQRAASSEQRGIRDQGSGIRDQELDHASRRTPHVSRFTFHVSLQNLKSTIQNVWPGLAVGAAFAAGPLVLPFAPFIGVWWLRRGWRYALAQGAAAAVVGLLTVGPFLLWDRQAFWLGAVTWFNDIEVLPRAKWETDQSWIYEIGLAGQFWQAGLEGWLKPLQFAGLGLLAVASWGRLRAPADVLRWGSAAYILFMVVNPVIWPYLFTPALLGLVFTLAARGRAVPAGASP